MPWTVWTLISHNLILLQAMRSKAHQRVRDEVQLLHGEGRVIPSNHLSWL